MSLPVYVLASVAERAAGDTVLLDGDEGHHAAVVRRTAVGELVGLTDGAGTLAQCRVTAVDKNGLAAEVLDVATRPPELPEVVVVQAIPKGERGELAVEMLTEVGVDVIVPWTASRSVARWRGEIVVVVGPEGGISDEELAAFGAVGAEPLRMGSSVLRSSTAGVAAVAALLARTPRWR